MMDDRFVKLADLKHRRSAFEELAQRYQDRLYNAVLSLIGNSDDAIDVVQETFYLAYRSLENFRGDCTPYTWLYRIALNSVINLRRKKQKVVSLSSDGPDQGIIDLPDKAHDSHPGFTLLQAEEERRVQDALGALADEYRVPLLLKEIEGMTYEDMAQVLSVPVGTIRSRLHRARVKLRAILNVNDEDACWGAPT